MNEWIGFNVSIHIDESSTNNGEKTMASSSSSSSSRKRDASTALASTTATTTSAHPSFLMDCIRSAEHEHSEVNVEKRTKFIKSQLDQMNEEQLTRFEFFVRSHLNRGKVKEILNAKIPEKVGSVNDEMAIVAGSLSKLFVGELVETALDVMRERMALQSQWSRESGQEGGGVTDADNSSRSREDISASSDTRVQRLQVDHIQEAFRRMQCEGKVGKTSNNCPLTKDRLFQCGSNFESILAATLEGDCPFDADDGDKGTDKDTSGSVADEPADAHEMQER